jgi:hypothetical protein
VASVCDKVRADETATFIRAAHRWTQIGHVSLNLLTVTRPKDRGGLWLALLALGSAAVGCRLGYDELAVLGVGAAGSTSAAGASAVGGTGAGGDAGEWGAGGDAPDGGGVGGRSEVSGAAGMAAGGMAAGGRGGAASGSSGTAGSGGESGTSGGASAGTSGSGGSGGGNTGGSGGGSGGFAAAAGAGGGGTPPDSASCTDASFGGHEYLLCEEMRTWFDAHGGCAAIGMRLVRVDDANENQWLFDNAVVPGGRDSQIWLGAWDVPREGEWRWTDGELFWLGDQMGSAQSGLFSGWSPREPNDVGGAEECASLETNTSAPEWFDSECDLLKAYVCESL